MLASKSESSLNKKGDFSAKKREEVLSDIKAAKDAIDRNYSASESAVNDLDEVFKKLKSVLKNKIGIFNNDSHLK